MISLVLPQTVEVFMFYTKYYSAKKLETKAKVIMKVIFEYQGRIKMTEKCLHKNLNIFLKKNSNFRNLFTNIIKTDNFVTEENISTS